MAICEKSSQRILNRIKEPFTTRVKPSQILPYLTFLHESDEQEIRNAETTRSDTIAAQMLLGCLHRYPNWFDQLAYGLNKLELYDILETLQGAREEIEVRITIENSADPSTPGEQGSFRCFGGNCSPEAQENQLPSELMKWQLEKKIEQEKLEIKKKNTQLDLATNYGNVAEKAYIRWIENGELEEDIDKKLETLRGHFNLENLYQGSMIFVFKAHSLSDLDMFEKLLKGGGLQDLLTHQILSAERIEQLRTIARDEGLNDDMSRCHLHIDVDDSQVPLCRSWLMEQQVTVSPETWKESMIQYGKNIAEDNIVDILVAFRTALPQWFQSMLVDPFLEDELHSLISDGIAQVEMREDKLIEWVIDKLNTYSMKFSEDELSDIEKLAWVVFGNVQEKSSSVINSSDDGSNIVIEDYVERYLITRMNTDLKLKHNINLFVEKDVLKQKSGISKSFIFKSNLFLQYFICHKIKCFKNVKMPRDLKTFFRTVARIEDMSYLAPLLSVSPSQFVHIKNIVSKEEAFDFCHIQLPIATHNKDFAVIKLCKDILEGTDSSSDEAMQTEATLDVHSDAPLSFEMPLNFHVNLQDLFSVYKTDLRRYVRLLIYFTRIVKLVNFSVTSFLIPFDSSKVELKNLEKIATGCFEDMKAFWKNLSVKEFEFDGLLQFVGNIYSISDVVRIQSSNLLVNEKDKFQINLELSCEGSLNYFGTVLDSIDISQMAFNDKFDHFVKNISQLPATKKFVFKNSSTDTLTLNQLISSLKTQTLYLKNLSLVNLNSSSNMFAPDVGLHHFTNIVTLTLDGLKLTDNELQYISKDICYLTKLKEISIAENNISSLGMQSFCVSLVKNEFLTILRVHGNPIKPEGAFSLSFVIHRCSFLEILNVSECQLGDPGAQYIARALSGKKHLKRISFRDNGIGPVGSKALFNALRDSCGLQFFDYGKNEVGLNCHHNLSSLLAECKFLDYISLWNCQLGVKGGSKTIPLFENMSHLQTICLQENNFNNADARFLASRLLVADWPHVKTLNLLKNKITDDGALEFARAIRRGHMNLKELLLSHNEIGLDGLRLLVDAVAKNYCPSLEVLDVSANKYVTKEDEDEIESYINLKSEVYKTKIIFRTQQTGK